MDEKKANRVLPWPIKNDWGNKTLAISVTKRILNTGYDEINSLA